MVVAAAHLVDLARQVEGDHRLAAVPVGGAIDRRHDRVDAMREGAGRAVGLELVVLDEIEAGRREFTDEGGGRRRIEAHARLDDRTDQRPPLDAGEPARAGDAEARAG